MPADHPKRKSRPMNDSPDIMPMAQQAAQEWEPFTHNHDPSYWQALREAYAEGFCKGYHAGQTPYEMTQDPAYQAWVEKMAEQCHCEGIDRPCDGVLAGGICDGIKLHDGSDADDADDYDDDWREPAPTARITSPDD